MKGSPLAPVAAVLGLVLLLPTTMMLFRGELTAADAGLRAVVILLGVWLLSGLSSRGLRTAAKVAARSSARGFVLTADQAALLNPEDEEEDEE